jgi:hypothetical protein
MKISITLAVRAAHAPRAGWIVLWGFAAGACCRIRAEIKRLIIDMATLNRGNAT